MSLEFNEYLGGGVYEKSVAEAGGKSKSRGVPVQFPLAC